ncbi:MAG TPA: HNH endonuclease signature motif containing protein, partial [Streptosporangiaceae bacterium]
DGSGGESLNQDDCPSAGTGAASGEPADGSGTGQAADGTGAGPAPAGTGAAGAGAGPAGGALGGTITLTMPLSAWLGLSEAPGEVAGHGPVDAGTCRDLAARTGAAARWCLTLTGGDGRAVAHACASAPPQTGTGTIVWAAAVRDKLQFLESGTCGHARRTSRYRPPVNLVHLVRVRQRTCSFPGCRRPARRADLDHTVPYDQGGMTCECNLAPLCRRHHQAKQAHGWHLTQDQPGVMTWRTPSGRSYVTTPEPYPV